MTGKWGPCPEPHIVASSGDVLVTEVMSPLLLTSPGEVNPLASREHLKDPRFLPALDSERGQTHMDSDAPRIKGSQSKS